ncbi:MAG: Rieske (2Fe-2S) protein, partial [Deltaproteobacteria bacterium]|nr:Rieske (2Fe-2S) protein [Deltaproteobacteria bacterium]
GEVVLVRRGGELRGLSARCPHLGCRIDQLDGEALLCPCHGSRFDLEGRPLTGPARGELTRLQLHPGSVAGTVDVHLPS